MRRLAPALLTVLMGAISLSPALADQEASNVAHVVAGPYGRCYAKSVPSHIYDPEHEPRQQGHTEVYRVENTKDVLLHRFDWFSQNLFVRCAPGSDTVTVRVGPWHRGRDPREDHLAIAFYVGDSLIKKYSTLDIAGRERAANGAISEYKNASASVSHYTVFLTGPEMTRTTTSDGGVFTEDWAIEAKTVDGRSLFFDMATGELR